MAAFGVLSFVQSFIILGISIRFIGFPCVGNVWFLVLTCMLPAMTSVSLGLLVSALARTPFQVVQMMLLFVVPQILLCGLFDLSGAPMWLQAIGKCCPLTYGVEVLRDVMLRGKAGKRSGSTCWFCSVSSPSSSCWERWASVRSAPEFGAEGHGSFADAEEQPHAMYPHKQPAEQYCV